MTDPEYITRLKYLVDTGRTQEVVKEAFQLYNERMQPKESKTFCGGCVERVFGRLRLYIKQHG